MPTLADGQHIACATAGSGPDVVCLPGGPARAGVYLGDLGGLDATHTLHVVDPRGCGGSRPADPTTVTCARLAADVVELVGLLGLERPALLAHSYAARVATAAVSAHPDLVGALVLVTPAPLVFGAEFAAARAEILEHRSGDPAYAEAVEAARALPDARPRDRSFLEEAARPLSYGRWDAAAQQHAAAGRGQVDVRAAMALRNDLAAWTPPDLSTLVVPTLVVAGSLDFLLPPRVAHDLHEQLPDSTYAEMEGAGHFPWLDDGEAFASIVGDFLAGEGLA